jgi:hypothetical protein
MDFKERVLYSQIHPAKLLTDWCAGMVSLYIFWQHNLALGIAVAVIPTLLAAVLVIRFADLYRYKKSQLGRYIHKYGTVDARVTRLFGYLVSAAGAWYQMLPVVAVGLALVILAWLRGSFRV